MNLRALSLILDATGTLILGIAVMLTHGRLLKERRIDKYVVSELKIESTLSFVALILIALGLTLALIDVL